MDLLRRHLFLMICAMAGVAGVVLGVTGLRAMPQVSQEMEKADTLYRNLQSLQSQPVNQRRIDAEEKRIEAVQTDHKRIIEKAKTLYNAQLLVPGVLPYGKPVERLKFRGKYGEAMRDLLNSLTWGTQASAADIDTWRSKIADERAERRSEGAARDPGPTHTPAGFLTEAGIREDPRSRAHLAAAQRIYCYALDFETEKTLEEVPSLDFDPVMAMTDFVDAPLEEDTWRAQLGYWIQKDVVEAIVAVNEEAAKQARDAGGQPWVGVMPVKDVISIRLSEGLIPPEGDAYVGHPPEGYAAALPPGTPATVFTQTGSGDAFDVVQFTVKLVMDQRDVPLLVEQICNDRFHTLLRVAYAAVPPNRKITGKIYGSEPAVIVVMDFETILLGEVFRRWMPALIREENEVRCREVDECQDESE